MRKSKGTGVSSRICDEGKEVRNSQFCEDIAASKRTRRIRTEAEKMVDDLRETSAVQVDGNRERLLRYFVLDEIRLELDLHLRNILFDGVHLVIYVM